MPKPDHDIEGYLKEFQPRAIRALQLARPTAHPWAGRMAVAALAAVMVLAIGISLWDAHRKTSKPRHPGTVRDVRTAATELRSPRSRFWLTRLALEDDSSFDALMTSESRIMLPDLHREQSTLRILAKE